MASSEVNFGVKVNIMCNNLVDTIDHDVLKSTKCFRFIAHTQHR